MYVVVHQRHILFPHTRYPSFTVISRYGLLIALRIWCCAYGIYGLLTLHWVKNPSCRDCPYFHGVTQPINNVFCMSFSELRLRFASECVDIYSAVFSMLPAVVPPESFLESQKCRSLVLDLGKLMYSLIGLSRDDPSRNDALLEFATISGINRSRSHYVWLNV